MERPPGGLVAGQRRPRALALAQGVDWYLAEPGRFVFLGNGDVSVRDFAAVRAELAESIGGQAVFVCVARPRELEEFLGKKRWGTKRITWSERLGRPIAPTVAAIARGARLALLPGEGIVWVDGEHLFKAGEEVPLPWMEPAVSLVVRKPREIRRAIERVLGPGGPARAEVTGG